MAASERNTITAYRITIQINVNKCHKSQCSEALTLYLRERFYVSRYNQISGSTESLDRLQIDLKFKNRYERVF